MNTLYVDKRTLKAYGQLYTVREEKVIDVEIDVQQERTSVKINYIDKREPALILLNPKPCVPDYSLLSHIVNEVFRIDRETFRPTVKVS